MWFRSEGLWLRVSRVPEMILWGEVFVVGFDESSWSPRVKSGLKARAQFFPHHLWRPRLCPQGALRGVVSPCPHQSWRKAQLWVHLLDEETDNLRGWAGENGPSPGVSWLQVGTCSISLWCCFLINSLAWPQCSVSYLLNKWTQIRQAHKGITCNCLLGWAGATITGNTVSRNVPSAPRLILNFPC